MLLPQDLKIFFIGFWLNFILITRHFFCLEKSRKIDYCWVCSVPFYIFCTNLIQRTPSNHFYVMVLVIHLDPRTQPQQQSMPSPMRASWFVTTRLNNIESSFIKSSLESSPTQFGALWTTSPLIIPTLLFPSFLRRYRATRNNNSYEALVCNRDRPRGDTWRWIPRSIPRSLRLCLLGFHGAVLFHIRISMRSFFIGYFQQFVP